MKFAMRDMNFIYLLAYRLKTHKARNIHNKHHARKCNPISLTENNAKNNAAICIADLHSILIRE
jgi:hypothetical protein